MKIDTTQMIFLGVQPYIFWVGIGSIMAFLSFNVMVYRERLDIRKSNLVIAISVIPLIMGAKMVGTIYSLLSCLYYDIEINLDIFIYSGIVFYGGLIFFLFSVKILTLRWTHEEKDKILDCVAITIPCFHIFGRIGCFFAGCCYGIRCKSLISIIYINYVKGNIVEEQRLPIQLIESMFNLLLLVFLAICKKKNLFRERLIFIYLIIYATVRFVIEFFRGDWDRRVFYPFSGSQIIGMIILLVTIKFLRLRRKENV